MSIWSTRELRYRPAVVARVPVRVHVRGRAPPLRAPVTGPALAEPTAAATSPGDARDDDVAKRWGKPVELKRRRGYACHSGNAEVVQVGGPGAPRRGAVRHHRGGRADR